MLAGEHERAGWLARQSRFVLMVAILLVGGGVYAALRLPVALFPQIDFPRIAVAIDAGDRSAERMLTEVTVPVEEAVRSVPGVRSVRSKTTRGSAEMSMTFDWNHDMVAALLQVQAALGTAAGSLPGVSVSARRMDPTVFPVLGYSISSDERSLVELRDLAMHRLRPALGTVEGVARVDVAGGDQDEVSVEVDVAALSARGLTIADIAGALSGSNVVEATGRVEDHQKLYLVMVQAPLRGVEDLEAIVLRAGANGLVRLGDVARVAMARVPRWTRVTADGHDAVLVQVYQQPSGNTVQLARGAAEALAGLLPTLPPGVKIANWYDQSRLVESSATSLRDAVVIGAGLAALVLLLFLRNLRITLIALVTVPGVLAAACLLLMVMHQTLNIMTLGGMAAAVGLIIDDAIVMVEHVIARVRSGGSAGWSRPRVLGAAGEFTRPLLGASLATIVIHIPPAFLSGVSGEFFKALSLTIAACLVVSFFVAWALVPLLASVLLRARDATVKDEGPIYRAFARGYGAVLGVAVARGWLVLIPCAALIFAGWFVYPRLKSGFMPTIDEGGFVLDYKTPPGTSLAETDRVLRQVEAIIRATPEVETYSRRTGLQLGGGLTEANEGDFFIRLSPPPRRPIEEVMDDVRTRVEGTVPGINIEMAQLMEDLIGDLTAVPQPIEVKLYSEDQGVLNEVAPRVKEAISKVAGVVDVNDGLNVAGDALDVRVDPLLAAAEGLDASGVSATLQKLLSGTVATRFETFGETPKVIGVRVIAPLRERRIEDDLDRLLLTTPDGRQVPLKHIAKVHQVSGQAQIQREDLRRMVAVTARLSGQDLGAAIADVKEALSDPALLAPGPSLGADGRDQGNGATARTPPIVILGGLYKEQQSAFAGLMGVFGAAVLLLFALLVYWLQSIRVAACLVVTSLLALPGVVLGLWATGTELNISSMMGLAMIVGSVTEVGVFLCSELLTPIDHATALGSGVAPHSMMLAAALKRLRPITMTTLAATLAMLPLVVGLGEGAAMLRPLAVVIVAGLVIQLPLVLLVLPALLSMCGVGRPRPKPIA